MNVVVVRGVFWTVVDTVVTKIIVHYATQWKWLYYENEKGAKLVIRTFSNGT